MIISDSDSLGFSQTQPGMHQPTTLDLDDMLDPALLDSLAHQLYAELPSIMGVANTQKLLEQAAPPTTQLPQKHTDTSSWSTATVLLSA